MQHIHRVDNRFSPTSLPPFSTSLPITNKPRLSFLNYSTRLKPIANIATSRFHNLLPLASENVVGAPNDSVTVDDEVRHAHLHEYLLSEIGSGYRVPPQEIRDIVDAPPPPKFSLSPQRDRIIFVQRRSLPLLLELARPDLKLAGLRIDGKSNCRSRMPFFTGIRIHNLLNDGTLGPETEIHGLPNGAQINFVTWSIDGRYLSLSIRVGEEDGSCSKLTLWIIDVETGKARPLFQSPDIYLNTIFDNFVWVNESTLLVCTIPLSRGNPPKKPLVPSGPMIQSNEQKNVIEDRIHQDMLKDETDMELFEYYATTQLVLVSLDGTTKEFGPPAIYTSVKPSPDQKYVLIHSIHRPFSSKVPCERFPKKVDVWTSEGKFVRELCDLPLANISIAFNSVRQGMRSINWRADKPSSLYWVETQDGGDAKVKVSPRDIIYTQPAEPLANQQPTILHKLKLRYRAISWCDDSVALVSEIWYKTREENMWVISPGSNDVSPRILFERSLEDVYNDFGSPMLRKTPAGTYVIAKVKKENDEGTYILLNGTGASPEGSIPFLDLLEINTGSRERIWECEDKYYEKVVALASGKKEGDLNINDLKVLTKKESKTERRQYYIRSWPDKKACRISNFPHPYSQLASLQKEMIRYERKDGVQLTATLYLPPGYDPSKDGPLPCLVWAYPEEFKSKDAAEQVRSSPNEFTGIGPTSPLLWLARRFAILLGPSIPIIGEGDKEANDRYVEQVVASAEAAVEEVIRRGVAHPNKIAVGGHSYGAFMAANLLAHASHLFCCGIARSGAYNRTLTPFGFQREDRTLWDASDTYIQMSPFMFANKIKKPILLIHGEQDGNVTKPMQSMRFFDALKGNSALSRLVILPYEGHSYSARESIMHVLWETDRWLQKYCVSNNENAVDLVKDDE